MGKSLQAPRKRGLGATPPRPEPIYREPRPALAAAADVAAAIPAERRRVNYTGPLIVAADRELPSPPTVSVICPTYNRHAMHDQLYMNFHEQDYPFKDIWILEDTHAASPFFRGLSDPEVHYLHTSQKKTIGAKRNQAILLSGGSIIAHFDDDDVYAPNYLSSMVDALVQQDADFVKLSTWNERRLLDGHRRVVDARRQVHANMWGWGFTYMYRRSVCAHASFPNINSGEDYAFVQAVQAAGLRTAQVDGGESLVEHVLHGRNVSRKE